MKSEEEKKKKSKHTLRTLLFGTRKKKKQKRASDSLHIGCLCVAILLIILSVVLDVMKADIPSKVDNIVVQIEDNTGKSADELWGMFENGEFEELESIFTGLESNE